MTNVQAGLLTRPRYTIRANDGDCEDGGTTYVLQDENGELVAAGPWPMPLELLAATRGCAVDRLPARMGFIHDEGNSMYDARSEIEEIDLDTDNDDGGITDAEIDEAIGIANGHEHPITRADDPRYAAAPEVVAAAMGEMLCKVDGCTKPWLTRKGVYGRLCAEHKADRMQAKAKAAVVSVFVATEALAASDGTPSAGLALAGIAAEVERVYDDLLAAEDVVGDRKQTLAALLEQLAQATGNLELLAGIGN